MSLPPRPPTFTHRVERSPLLDRLQSFLPQLQAANEQLEKDIQKDGAEKFSFEDTTGCENPIRLQISIGVLEPQRAAEDVQKPKNELNPHNLAILPSELEQKRSDDKPQALVMPWHVGLDSKKSTNIGQKNKISLIDEVNSDEDCNDTQTMDDVDDNNNNNNNRSLHSRKKQRLSSKTIQNDDENTQIMPLLGTIEPPTEEMLIEQDSIKLGSHLFEEDEIITAAQAVEVLRELGYAPVSDINFANSYHTADEIDSDFEQDGECIKEKKLIEEIME
jgi:hypothetical protein